MARMMPLALLVLLVPVAARAQDKVDKTRVEKDLVYAKVAGKEIKLDLAMPTEGNGPFPALVFIHGGGWKHGSYRDLANTLPQFAAHGYVAVSVQYRLTPDYQFPAPVEDVKCAVRWLRSQADRYKIDANHIGAIGFSAGAHLALMLGVTTPADGLEGSGDLTQETKKLSSQVQAAVSFFGPTDLTTGDWDKAVEPLLLDFLGGTLQAKREAYAQASPLTYVKNDRKYPPILCFHGTKDNIVHYDQSVKFVAAMKASGGSAELVTMEGDGHGWGGAKLSESIVKTMEFFDKHLKAQGAAGTRR